MQMSDRRIIKIFFLLFILSFSATSFGQFYKIYGYGTLEAGELELVYWNTLIPSSDGQIGFFGNVVDRKGLMAHSLEVEYGLSHKWTVAAYADFIDPVGEKIRYVQAKAIMTHYRFFEKGSRPLDIGIYLEYKLPRKGYKGSEELEAKIILEKDAGFWTFVFNPTFEKKMSGEDVAEGMEFAFNAGLYYRELPWLHAGIEYYSKYGEIRNARPPAVQEHVLFPTIDLMIYPRYHLHTGLGIGLSKAADNLIWKTILAVEFPP